MSNGKDSRYAEIASTGAAIAGVMAWLEARKKRVTEPGDEIVIPEELMVLIAAIAANSDNILDELRKFVLDPSLTIMGWPPNTSRMRTITVHCTAANTAYQADTLEVPDGMALIIKSYPTNAAGSILRVGTTQFEATSLDMSYPLEPNEAVAYHVKNASQFWVSSTVAGSIAVFSTEQEV